MGVLSFLYIVLSSCGGQAAQSMAFDVKDVSTFSVRDTREGKKVIIIPPAKKIRGAAQNRKIASKTIK